MPSYPFCKDSAPFIVIYFNFHLYYVIYETVPSIHMKLCHLRKREMSDKTEK